MSLKKVGERQNWSSSEEFEHNLHTYKLQVSEQLEKATCHFIFFFIVLIILFQQHVIGFVVLIDLNLNLI